MARIIVYIYSIYAPSRTSESQGLSFTCSNLDWAFTCYFKRYPAIFGLKKGFGPSQWWLCLSLPGEFRGRGVFDIGEWFLLTDKSSQISPEGGFWHPMFYFRDFKVFRFFFGRELAASFSEFFSGILHDSPRECHGRLPRGLPAGAQEFQRHHHWGTHAEGPELDNYSWLMLIDRVLIGIVGLFWIINGIVFSVPPISMVYGGYNYI